MQLIACTSSRLGGIIETRLFTRAFGHLLNLYGSGVSPGREGRGSFGSGGTERERRVCFRSEVVLWNSTDDGVCRSRSSCLDRCFGRDQSRREESPPFMFFADPYPGQRPDEYWAGLLAQRRRLLRSSQWRPASQPSPCRVRIGRIPVEHIFKVR